jgi:hypothetical protein
MHVFEWGRANDAELSNAIGVANQVQDSFQFELHHEIIPLKKRYKLQNGGYDLDRAASVLLRARKLPKPLILMTSLPYTDGEHCRQKDWFFFGDISLKEDPETAIISSYIWESFAPKRDLEKYILLMLATVAIDRVAKVEFHSRTKGCPLDYCEEVAAIDQVLANPKFCRECEVDLEKKIRAGMVTSAELSSVRRLLLRAANKKLAFVIMPFKARFWQLYRKSIAPALLDSGWTPVTASDFAKPQDILEAIIRGIREADLIVADISETNANVFWEFGIAYALGKDFVVLSSKKKLPFDVARNRCIFYKKNAISFKKLAAELKKHF